MPTFGVLRLDGQDEFRVRSRSAAGGLHGNFVTSAVSLVNERAAFAALLVERTGIEPVTSGLQIRSGLRQRWSARVTSGHFSATQ